MGACHVGDILFCVSSLAVRDEFMRRLKATLPFPSNRIFLINTRNARAPTSTRSIGFCAIWVCISSSSDKNYGWSSSKS